MNGLYWNILSDKKLCELLVKGVYFKLSDIAHPDFVLFLKLNNHPNKYGILSFAIKILTTKDQFNYYSNVCCNTYQSIISNIYKKQQVILLQKNSNPTILNIHAIRIIQHQN